jgi:4-alpha-glucanotransferase
MQKIKRNSGIVLHITSLPGNDGIGTLGENAYRFIDFLADTGQELWQILPLGPVGYGNSPYQCYSAFAGNPLLIDIDLMVNEGLLTSEDLDIKPTFPLYRVVFDKVEEWKYPVLKKAFEKFLSTGRLSNEYHTFLDEHQWWLNDYALFMASKKHFNNIIWTQWDKDLKFREKTALDKYSSLLEEEIGFRKFLQFMFFRQWFRLKEYASSKHIKILGDLPLYVSGDSVDVWTNAEIFRLDKNLNQLQMGGVPPDYFSETGQLWGNPVFNWERLEERGFDWWMARLHFNLNMFDRVRIDHFRGLESYWSVPAGETTAIKGKWVPAKGYQMLKMFKKQVGSLSLVAEDLGMITDEVVRLRDEFNLPGMKVLQFAFGSDAANHNLPHNYLPNFIAYSGTHDNNTTLGWLRSLKVNEKKMVRRYLGTTGKKAVKNAVELIWSSCATSAIIPLQDLLELDERARLNTPGTAQGNWEWRFKWWQLKKKHRDYLRNITRKYNRQISSIS